MAAYSLIASSYGNSFVISLSRKGIERYRLVLITNSFGVFFFFKVSCFFSISHIPPVLKTDTTFTFAVQPLVLCVRVTRPGEWALGAVGIFLEAIPSERQPAILNDHRSECELHQCISPNPNSVSHIYPAQIPLSQLSKLPSSTQHRGKFEGEKNGSKKW